nr:RNA-directed DNA polymerase, eukaryota, reverse transcriptase zinc-binding domain protein [Tanacetum cinerariifolium]
MKLMKPVLNNLSWKDGNIFERVTKLRDRLKNIQAEVDKHPYNEDIKAESFKIVSEYYEALKDKNNFPMQKAKVEWLKDEEADKMCRNVSDAEVKNAMFDIEDSKAPGPDGYTTRSYKSAWSVIGKDICTTMQEFFVNGKLLSDVNATLISLVPKVQNPNRESKFSPIAYDLLVFCHGDIKSVNVIKKALEEFSSYSGLKANMRRLIVRYLRVPLITKKINATDCKPLVEKVKDRVLELRNKVKENQEKDKIGSKPHKNGKRGEARKSLKQLQLKEEEKLKKTKKEWPKTHTRIKSYSTLKERRKEKGQKCNSSKVSTTGAKFAHCSYVYTVGLVMK